MTTSSYESLSHSKWDCKYHIVFVPKYCKKVLYGQIRRFLGPVFSDLASPRSCKIVEGHMVQDHVHMLIAIPPKYSVAEVVGYIKGKSTIAIARQFSRRKRNFNGERFIVESHMVQDHVHMLIAIPPKYSVAEVIGYIKGKSTIAIARQFSRRKRNFNGERFLARGYTVSTAGFEETKITEYIRNQEQLDQMSRADENDAF